VIFGGVMTERLLTSGGQVGDARYAGDAFDGVRPGIDRNRLAAVLQVAAQHPVAVLVAVGRGTGHAKGLCGQKFLYAGIHMFSLLDEIALSQE
jgi:hypothetical protein